jgi:hypothetical protein
MTEYEYVARPGNLIVARLTSGESLARTIPPYQAFVLKSIALVVQYPGLSSTFAVSTILLNSAFIGGIAVNLGPTSPFAVEFQLPVYLPAGPGSVIAVDFNETDTGSTCSFYLGGDYMGYPAASDPLMGGA